MIKAWRLVKPKHVESAFNGEGPRIYGGRWNSEGTVVVYTASSAALAALEIIVNTLSVDPASLLKGYRAIPLQFEDSLVQTGREVPDGWDHKPPGPESQLYGDRWVAKKSSLVLEVPSVVVPLESNFLINPNHPYFKKISIGKPVEFKFDKRIISVT